MGQREVLGSNSVSSLHFKLLSVLISVLALFQCYKYFSGSVVGVSDLIYSSDVLGEQAGNKCANYEKLFGNSKEFIYENIINNEVYRNQTAAKLSHAVQIDTSITDDFPNPQDYSDFEGWANFKKLHQQLQKDFPLVWSQLKVETVNHFSLLLTWEGSDSTLKPNLFMAHEDVVPVDNRTLDQWDHAPFSGDFDGQYVWGRGSFDDKNMLIAMLESVEFILKNEPDFKPKRTLLVALGSDEEITGYYGHAYIKDVVLERYGKNGVYSIVDEGGTGVNKLGDIWIASPGTAEKGYLNLHFAVSAPGGHSSMPPDHTSVGIASAIIAEIENEKFPLLYTEQNPITKALQCAADNSKMIPPSLKSDIRNALRSKNARTRVLQFITAKGGRLAEYLFRTSQAATVINGGVKGNVIPELTEFNINSRVAVESSIKESVEKLTSNALVIAKKYNLGLTVFDKEILPRTASGDIQVTLSRALEPAPVSPTNNVWEEFAGTIKGYFEDIIIPNKYQEEVNLIIAPSIMPANTDTWHYWDLTENIYRFQPGTINPEIVSHIHATNEHIELDTLMYAVGFFYDYIHVLNK